MRRLLLIAWGALLLLAACRKDDRLVDLTAVVADQPARGSAKVYVDNDRYACWHHGDYVNVNGESYSLTVEPGTGSHAGAKVAKIFDVNESENGYTAGYPTGCISGITEGGTTATATVLSLQPYIRATVYDGTGETYQQLLSPMIAHCESESEVLKFHNVACVLKVTVHNASGVDLNMHYVTIKSEGAYLAGSASISGIGTDAPEMGIPTSGYHGITVDCNASPIALSDGADTVLYVVSAPFTNQTLIVRVLAKDEDENYYTLTATSAAPLSLSRNQMGQATFNVGDCSCSEESIVANRCNYAFWGCGTRRYPFLITNKEDLLRFRGFTLLSYGADCTLYAKNTSVYYEQICNVDASDEEWTTGDSEFWGHYNGGGYSIKLKLGTSGLKVGFISSLSGATISNLTLTGDAVTHNSTASGNNSSISVGAFCCTIIGTSPGSQKTIFENCVNRIPISTTTASQVTQGNSAVGGFVARAVANKVTFRNCSNEATITSRATYSSHGIYTGGLLGYGTCDSMVNCTNHSAITGKDCTGGLLGYGSSYSVSVTLYGNCSNTSPISGRQKIGGLVGYVVYLLRINGEATNSGSVTGTDMNVGGILGRSDTILTLSANSHITNSGAVSGTTNTGGIAGYVSRFLYVNQGVVAKNMSSGNISGNGYVGGCFGYVGTFVSNNTTEYSFSNAASVTGSSYYVGGILGSCNNYSSANRGTTYYSQIYHCTNSGAVSGTYNIGGIAGYARCKELKYCTNNAVTVTGTYQVGGVVGYTSGSTVTLSELSNTASVRATKTGNSAFDAAVGGIVGYGYSSSAGSLYVINCHNSGDVECTGSNSNGKGVAGVIGYGRIQKTYIYNCYNTGSVVSSNVYSAGILGLTYYYTGSSATNFYVQNCWSNTTNTFSGSTIAKVYGGTLSKSNCYVNSDNGASTDNADRTFNTSTGALSSSITVNTVSCSTLYQALHNWYLANSTYSDWTNATLPALAWE